MLSTVDAACAIEADGVVFHVGSHLGTGFEAGLQRAVPAIAEVLERSSDTTWLLLENSAGAGGTIGRSIEELAALFDALDRHPRLGVCLDSCHLCVSGFDVGDRDVLAACSRTSTPASASTGCERCTSTTPRRRSARTATGTRTSSRATSASSSEPSSPIQPCRAYRR